MYRKSAVFLLVILLSLCQIPFAVAQTSSSDNLILLLAQSNMVVTVDVKRILSEAAPDIFNNDPSAMEKLKTAMKSVEDNTGINPSKVNKIAFGINVSKAAPENAIFVLQTDSSPAQMADNIFQNQVATAKFSMEKNPLHNRLWNLKIKMSSITEFTDDDAGNLMNKRTALLLKVNEIQNALYKIQSSKANAPIIENFKKVIQDTETTLSQYVKMIPINRRFDDLTAKQSEMESSLEKIELSDTQRMQKISAITNDIDKLEKEFAPRIKVLTDLLVLKELTKSELSYLFDGTPLTEIENSLKNLPVATVRRTQTLQKELESLREFQTKLQAALDAIKESEPAEAANTDQNNEGAVAIRPLYVNVSRRDETVGGKKMLTIITKTKYKGEKGEDYELDDTSENAVGLADETTLIYGKSETVKQILENKTPNQNQMLTSLINRSPNALMAFAVDLQDVDLSSLGNLLGEKPTVWQVHGSLTSANKEVSLTASIEKTNIPLKTKPQNPTDNNIKIPVVENSSAATDILNLLAKTLIGVEGKLTFKFDKRKTAALIEETPKIFGAMMRSDKR